VSLQATLLVEGQELDQESPHRLSGGAVLDLRGASCEAGLDLLTHRLQREPQHLVLRAEPVLHESCGHAGLGRDVPQAHLVETAGGGHPVQRPGDLLAALAGIDLLRHRRILTRCSRIATGGRACHDTTASP
jgi:hypothetical protein